MVDFTFPALFSAVKKRFLKDVYLILPVFLCFFMIANPASAQQPPGSQSLLEGQWVLKKLVAPDTVRVHKKAMLVQIKDGSKVPIIPDSAYNNVCLQDYLGKDLVPGVTKLVFSATDVQFYRGQKLTHSGKWEISGNAKDGGDALVFTYNNSANKKYNKLVSVDADELVLGTEEKGKPVTFYFAKTK